MITESALARWVREQGDGSRATLARRAGVQWQTVDAIVRGETTPRLDTARRLSEATDGAVTVAEILGLAEHEVRTSSEDAA